jgi:hypothetical protein
MDNPINDVVRAALLIVGALFPIVNSPENVPLFLLLTAAAQSQNRFRDWNP